VKSSSILFFAGVCLILVAQTSSAQTLAVGNCQPQLVSYLTISAAVAAAASGSTVLVCPGTYPEQVVITQPLTLRGLNLGIFGNNPVIAVPSGGLLVTNLAGDALQLSVQGTDASAFGPVNVSTLVVDGTGAQFTCMPGGGNLIGIGYVFSTGTLTNVTAQNQAPGGCGMGISLTGDPSIVSTVTVQNSTVAGFDGTGVLADGTFNGELTTEFFVNLESSSITSTSPVAAIGIEYLNAGGLVQNNTVTLPTTGLFGMEIANFFGSQTTRHNTVTGAGVGIFSGASEAGVTNITSNSVFNSGTGIGVDGFGSGAIIQGNAITGSSAIAINMDCSELAMAEGNTIFGAPVGIANIAGNIFKNTFNSVVVQRTFC
jgi:nitrous oxidase accessory protein NosD